MSVYIYEKNALKKMAQIEGERWMEQQDDDPKNPCSFYAFLNIWRDHFSQRQSLMEEGARLNCFISVEANGAIYGDSGYNRYAVRYDGMVFFLRDFATQEAIRKATRIGFDLM